MIWMHVQMDSTALNMPVTLEILAPQPHGDNEGQKRRILFLLHDYGEDHTWWMRSSMVEQYASRNSFTVVMMSGDNSFFVNMKQGRRYGDFVGQELPLYCREVLGFPQSPDCWCIAGCGMGGYGALITALRHPDIFGWIGCFSPTDLTEEFLWMRNRQLELVFGSLEEYTVSQNSLLWALKRLQTIQDEAPELFYCIKERDCREQQRGLYPHSVRIRHVDPKEEWRYPDTCLEQFMNYVSESSGSNNVKREAPAKKEV